MTQSDVRADLEATAYADAHAGGFAMRRSATWRHVYYQRRLALEANLPVSPGVVAVFQNEPTDGTARHGAD